MARALALLLLLPTVATATHPCGQFFVKHHAVAVVAPYVAPVYYQAGVGIEQDALASKVARQVIAQIRAELKAPVQQQTSGRRSAIAEHCGKCHGGAAPKGGIIYDGQSLLECFQVTAALRAIANESMPKDHKVSPEVKGQLMQELLDLEQPADRPQRVEVPPPEETFPTSPIGKLQ